MEIRTVHDRWDDKCGCVIALRSRRNPRIKRLLVVYPWNKYDTLIESHSHCTVFCRFDSLGRGRCDMFNDKLHPAKTFAEYLGQFDEITDKAERNVGTE